MSYSTAIDEVLQEIEAFTIKTHPKSHMLSGALQGKFLEMISRMVAPEKILEVGTFTGFSALCLAKGLKPGGKLHTIEMREDDAAVARQFFAKAGMQEHIILHVEDAKECLMHLTETWDLVFLDADKVSYIEYYELILPRLRTGAWILADNVYFHGQVLDVPIRGKNAVAIHSFNEHVAQDPRTEQVILSIRDGLSIIRKI
jgi:predicted O-methyltransferase YrrM